MHEMGIALEIIDIVINSIPSNPEKIKVKKINIKIGKLSAITPESLEFCFDIASKKTAIAGAKLSLRMIPVVIKCKKCKNIHEIKNPIFKCIKCGSGSLDLITGRELDIISIEIEKKD